MYFHNPLARLIYSIWYLFSQKKLTDFPAWYEEAIMNELFRVTMRFMGDPVANKSISFKELRYWVRELYEWYDLTTLKRPVQSLDEGTFTIPGTEYTNDDVLVRFELQGAFFFALKAPGQGDPFLLMQPNRHRLLYPKSVIYRWAIKLKERRERKKLLQPIKH